MRYYKFNGNKVDILKFLEEFSKDDAVFKKEIVRVYNDNIYNFYYLKPISTPFVVQISLFNDKYIIKVTPGSENEESSFNEKTCVELLNIFKDYLKEIFKKYKIDISCKEIEDL